MARLDELSDNEQALVRWIAAVGYPVTWTFREESLNFPAQYREALAEAWWERTGKVDDRADAEAMIFEEAGWLGPSPLAR